jgi:hypothetical protein
MSVDFVNEHFPEVLLRYVRRLTSTVEQPLISLLASYSSATLRVLYTGVDKGKISTPYRADQGYDWIITG